MATAARSPTSGPEATAPPRRSKGFGSQTAAAPGGYSYGGRSAAEAPRGPPRRCECSARRSARRAPHLPTRACSRRTKARKAAMTEASEWRVPGYREESELGRGGGGRVVAAVEQASGERVAVKYLAGRLAGDEQFRAAFRGEAEMLASLDLPHVVKVRRYVESAEGAAIVMDMVTGVSL